MSSPVGFSLAHQVDEDHQVPPPPPPYPLPLLVRRYDRRLCPAPLPARSPLRPLLIRSSYLFPFLFQLSFRPFGASSCLPPAALVSWLTFHRWSAKRHGPRRSRARLRIQPQDIHAVLVRHWNLSGLRPRTQSTITSSRKPLCVLHRRQHLPPPRTTHSLPLRVSNHADGTNTRRPPTVQNLTKSGSPTEARARLPSESRAIIAH